MSTQVLELVASALLAVAAGRWLGRWAHRGLYRMTDDEIVAKLAGPISLVVAVMVWEALIHLLAIAPGVLAFEREIGSIALLVALAWAGISALDSGSEAGELQTTWVTGHPLAHTFLPAARRIGKIAIAAVAGVMMLAILGYAISPLVVCLAIAGIALALAAHRSLDNVFGTYALGADHPFREGDVIKLADGTTGTVEAIGLRATRIRTLDRSVVTMPNGELARSRIETLSQRDHIRFHTRLALPLGAPTQHIDRVLAELRELLRLHPQRTADQPVSVHLVGIRDGALELEAMAWFHTSWDDFQVVRDRLLVRCLEIIGAAPRRTLPAPRTVGGWS